MERGRLSQPGDCVRFAHGRRAPAEQLHQRLVAEVEPACPAARRETRGRFGRETRGRFGRGRGGRGGRGGEARLPVAEFLTGLAAERCVLEPGVLRKKRNGSQSKCPAGPVVTLTLRTVAFFIVAPRRPLTAPRRAATQARGAAGDGASSISPKGRSLGSGAGG